MNEEERYLFDLRGYLVIADMLTAQQLAGLNRLMDSQNLVPPGDDTLGARFGGFLEWGQIFCNLLDHARTASASRTLPTRQSKCLKRRPVRWSSSLKRSRTAQRPGLRTTNGAHSYTNTALGNSPGARTICGCRRTSACRRARSCCSRSHTSIHARRSLKKRSELCAESLYPHLEAQAACVQESLLRKSSSPHQ